MWEQIRSNRRKSAALVVLAAALLFALGYTFGEAVSPGAGPVGLAVAFVLWLVLTLVAYFQGDSILLAVSGARRIGKDDHPQLYNVVEEMTIAAGLPKMPDVYIIDDTALNAFATGRNPERAAVAVTAGLLGRLNRDQLQGVIAHEIAHVVNRDILFMTLIGVIVGTVVMLSEGFLRGIFRTGRTTRSSSRRSRSGGGGGGGNAIVILIALALAILAPLLGRLIYLAASRRREYLADAHAAVLTRYPEGLASALETIAREFKPVAAANTATAPLYIVPPMQARSLEARGLFSTHPPTKERIRILRSMAGNASYAEYQRAWEHTAKGQAGHLPPSALAAAPGPPIREGTPETPPPLEAARALHAARDAVRGAEGYAFLTCACGLKMKVPPDLPLATVECPRCGRPLSPGAPGNASPPVRRAVPRSTPSYRP